MDSLKKKVFFLLFTLFLLVGISKASISVSTFFLYVNQTGSIGFQHTINNTITITVLSGNLSGVNCSLFMSPYGEGYFSFKAQNNSVIRVDSVNINELSAKGDSGNNMRYIDSGSSLTIQSGNGVSIKWNFGIGDPFSWMIMPMMGIFGFFSIGLGAFFVGNKIRQRDAFGAIRGCLVALIFILIGAGLIIGWLW